MWELLRSLQGQTFSTLDQGRRFRLEEVGEQHLVVRVLTTGNIRQIRRREFEEPWQHLQTSRRLSRVEIQEEYSPFNPAYVSTLLAQLPGVKVTSRPIVLYYEEESSLPSERLSAPPNLEEPEEEPEAESIAVLEDVIARIARTGKALGFKALREIEWVILRHFRALAACKSESLTASTLRRAVRMRVAG